MCYSGLSVLFSLRVWAIGVTRKALVAIIPPLPVRAHLTPNQLATVPNASEPRLIPLIRKAYSPMILPRMASGVRLIRRVWASMSYVDADAPVNRIRARDSGRDLEKANSTRKAPKQKAAPMNTHPLGLKSPKLDRASVPISPPVPRKVERSPSTTGPASSISLVTTGNIDQLE